jgi:hypothetical protein
MVFCRTFRRYLCAAPYVYSVFVGVSAIYLIINQLYS